MMFTLRPIIFIVADEIASVRRFAVTACRDGKEEALAFATRCIRIYLAAIRVGRKNRNLASLKAAYSFRHTVRTIEA